MEVHITEWALQSYLELKHANVFDDTDYWNTLRPDVERLKGGLHPGDPKFQSGKFWGAATDKAGVAIRHGFKMKWHNLGPGRVQLRLAVAIFGDDAYLCQAYVKDSDATDKREMAKLKIRINLISLGKHVTRGKL